MNKQPFLTQRKCDSRSQPARWQVGTLSALAAVCLCLCGTGCNTFGLGNAKLVQELEQENNRLLAEFRAERDRREQTEANLRRTEAKLAESEKLLARQYGPAQNRLSSLGNSSYNPPTNTQRPGFSSELSGAPSYGSAEDDSGLRWQRRP